MPSKSTIVNLINILTGVCSLHVCKHSAWFYTFTDNGTSNARKLEFVMIPFHFISLHFFRTLQRNGPLLLWFHTKFPNDDDAAAVVNDDAVDDGDVDADDGDVTLL